MRMETTNEQAYMEYLQTLLVASYTMRPSSARSMEESLEEIAMNLEHDKKQVKIDVRRILNLRKALMMFLKNIVEEKFQNSVVNRIDKV